jgi:hypothetical protein
MSTKRTSYETSAIVLRRPSNPARVDSKPAPAQQKQVVLSHCELCQTYEPKSPSASTLQAMQELAQGQSKRFATVEELMADLNADD